MGLKVGAIDGEAVLGGLTGLATGRDVGEAVTTTSVGGLVGGRARGRVGLLVGDSVRGRVGALTGRCVGGKTGGCTTSERKREKPCEQRI